MSTEPLIKKSKEISSLVNKTPFINGRYTDSKASRKTLIVTNPLTEEAFSTLECADVDDVENAVESAYKAMYKGPWSSMHPRERAKLINKLANIIEENLNDIALLESLDTGKRFAGTKGWDIPNSVEVYRYYAGWADKIYGSYYPPIGNYRGHSIIQPIGVVAAIMPWNFPFACLAWKIAPALAAGCAIVIKSAERAPMTTQFFGTLCQQAGFPEGVINIITGIGETTGRELVRNKKVRKITFTGHTDTATDIIKNSSFYMPKLSLELGGKSPNIIMPSCNMKKALNGTMSAIFDVSGQNCLAGSRTFIHETIYDEFVESLVLKAERRILGDQFEETTEQGPQIDHNHITRIESFIKKSCDEGANIITGGKVSQRGKSFFEPTLIISAPDNSTINQDEVFGPVGSLLKFSDLDEAIDRSNNTEYGLAGAIWTSVPLEADHFTRKLEAGTVWVNCYGMLDTVAPWGGVKKSGYGKELGYEAIEQFVERKVIFEDIIQ